MEEKKEMTAEEARQKCVEWMSNHPGIKELKARLSGNNKSEITPNLFEKQSDASESK